MPTLSPKRVKYRKMFKGQRPGNAHRGNTLTFGQFGLLAQTRGWVSARQIESARKTLTHFTAKGGRVWIRIFPDKPVSKQPLDHRGGGGKGEVADYVAVVRPGLILFEMSGIPKDQAAEAIRRAGHKLSVQTKFIEKN
ncbi:MAG: 50S ribosomal protein L16 [Microgenomates group bacterium GW2011_GWA1_48_10]|uniref:Large ribosomal subunit protein uL16 n=1 Tax=Candidatus Gottesmanbacteria bacterium RIFCSPHIGHO2_01_FULL_47_48 TaxID=1798381 RepID=A0A1F6A2Q0_9BACT|nr:MAG: 50S ribosomal protein L16 [Microgenomates group bacterium GW2011_GWA1_48_10]OGG18874.1 MAG: 50S ribosomal protein L16 [Candidatus Gottesmanbacteria bacterium RIFCSPHIGHO2_01_FULL_47_48]